MSPFTLTIQTIRDFLLRVCREAGEDSAGRLANTPPARFPIPIESIEIESFRIEHATDPSKRICILGMRWVADALQEVRVAMRAADVLGRTGVLTSSASWGT